MQPEELRTQIIDQIDDTLRRWGIREKERAYLTGFRNYVAAMTTDELTKLGTFLPVNIRFVEEE